MSANRKRRLQEAAHPLHGVRARTRLGLVVTIVAVLTLAFFAGVGLSHGTAWVFSSEAGHSSNEAEAESPNACEGVLGIPVGTDPGWIRVGGSTEPSTPFIQARGQILQATQAGKTNPFITHTDAPFNHYSKDINAFLTLDDSYRHILSEGNFEEGDENEHGVLEVEWERGGIPLFAFPSAGDRMTLWGAHIWDCGHGDTWLGGDDTYRTEIHPPVGWVLYRQTADEDGAPQGDKREQDPWKYYESTDLNGIATTLPSTALKNTVVQATVADAFFSSFAGNVPEALNGCDTDFVDCEQDNEWRQSLLQQDYTFFVPAPAKPDPAAQLIWESEDRCGEVPSNPGNPPGDDVEDVGEAGDTAENIGAPTCNIPHEVTTSTDTHGRPGILVTVKASSGGVAYPANEFVVFAKRYKVAWDWVPPVAQRAKTFKVDLNHIKVYDDSEPCTEDGEWVMSIRVNEAWIHPVRGHGDDNDPFWEDGAVDDDKCIIGHDPTYAQYSVAESRTVSVVNGRSINIWSRTYDVDTFANDVLPVINVHRFGAGTFDDGETDHDVEGAHTLNYTITDVTPAAPSLGTLAIGDPKYGPNADTGGSHTRIAAATPISLEGSDGAELQYRLWKDGDATPAAWSYAADLEFTLGTASGDGRYTIEYAPVSAGGIVAERRTALVELDATPPVLTLPAPITVFADQTAGKVVNYTALAIDNLPGPVDFSCTPPTGSLFPNGTNAPLTTTVTCSATDAVDNNAIGSFTVTVVSPFGYVPDFVVIGKDWAIVGSGATVQTGNVGVFDQSAGVPTRPGFEIVAGPSARFLGGSQVAAHSDRVEASTAAGDVFYVDFYFQGNGATLTPKVGYVPLFYALPVFPSFTAGGGNLTLSGTTSLAPGTYGKLTVRPNATVTVNGGLYSFSGIEVKSGATLRFAAPTTIRVTGRTLIGNGTTLLPGSGSGVTAHDIMLFGAGVDGPPNKPADAIGIGSNVTLALNAYAPDGTLSVGAQSVATGAFIGKRVLVGGNVTLNEDSAFLSP